MFLKLCTFTFMIMTAVCANQASPLKKLTVSLGYHIDPCQAPILYGLHKGIFKRYGLDVELVTASGGEEASRAVAMKQADIGITKLANHIVRISKDMPLRRVSTLVPKTLEVLMVRRDVGEIKDLKNKRIGYSTSNPTFTMSVIEKILTSQGMTMNDVTLIAFHGGLARALATGAIDAAFTVTDPYETIFMEENHVDTITYRYQDFGIPEFPQFILFVHQDNKDAEFITLFNAALADAVRELKSSPREAWLFICEKYPELDDRITSRVFLRLIELFTETPSSMDIEGTQQLLSFMEKATFEGEKLLPKPVSMDQL